MSALDDIVGVLIKVAGDSLARYRTWDIQNGPTITEDAANRQLVWDFASVRPAYRELDVTTTDLTASSGSQDIDLGAVLPSGNVLLQGWSIAVATPLSGGGASSATASIGTSGDAVKVVNAADVFAAAVDGQASTLPLGRAPWQNVGGLQLKLRIAADVDVDTLTAGSLTVRVWYVELPA